MNQNNVHYSNARIRLATKYLILGKVLVGVLNAISLILVIRELSIIEFGVYTQFLGVLMLLFGISSIGMDVVLERYIPEIIIRSSKIQLAKFIILIVSLRSILVVCIVLLLYLYSMELVIFFEIESFYLEFKLFLVFVILYTANNIIYLVLESLLKQKLAQFVMAAYVILKLTILIILSIDQLSLFDVLLSEIISYSISLVITSVMILKSTNFEEIRSENSIVNFDKKRMVKFGLYNYAAHFSMMVYSSDVQKVIISKVVSLTETAKYGVVVAFLDIAQRYMPGIFLLRLIKPVFYSSYESNRDFSLLNDMASILLKINLIFIVTLFIAYTLFGQEILSVVTKDKYSDIYVEIYLALMILLFNGHQWIFSLLANTLELNVIQLKASLISSSTILITFILITKFGLDGALIGMLLSGVLYNILCYRFLRSEGYEYRIDKKSILWIVSSAFLILMLAKLVVFIINVQYMEIFIGGISTAGFLILMKYKPPLSSQEASLITKFKYE